MQISDQIIHILDDLCKKFGIVINWADENVIPYLTDFLHRYISYEIATSIVWGIVGVILIATGILCFIKLKNSGDEVDGIFIFYGFIILITWTSGPTLLLKQLYDIIACMIIPEIKIIEVIQNLMIK